MRKNRLKKTIEKAASGLTEELLGRFYASPLTFAETRRRAYGFLVSPKEISRKKLYDTMKRIHRQGWLEKKVVEDKVFYSLTNQGRIRYLIFRAQTAKRVRGKMATIIIFDIPEEKRTSRDFLRRLLKQMKFTQIQKSVLIAPYILPLEFYDLLKETDMLKFVKVIEGRLRV